MEDGGPIFVTLPRVGSYQREIHILKFRSMTGADRGEEVLKSKLVVTPLGRVLRRTRIDETFKNTARRAARQPGRLRIVWAVWHGEPHDRTLTTPRTK